MVQQFYDWYLGNPASGPKDARQSGYLSADLIERITQAIESQDPGSRGNFVCAQDFPDSVEIGQAQISSERATVSVSTSWGSKLEIGQDLIDNAWEIAEVKGLP